jgi:hypothetical protein
MPAEYVPTAKQRALVENAAALASPKLKSPISLASKRRRCASIFGRGGKFKVDMLAIQALAGTAVCLAWLASRLVTAGLDPA